MDVKLSARNADTIITSTVDKSSDAAVKILSKTCSKGQNRCQSKPGCIHDTHSNRSLFSEGNLLVTLVIYIKAFIVNTK